MEKEFDDDKQWQKMKDSSYIGFVGLGLGSTTEAIDNNIGFPLVAFGFFWIIIGLVQVNSWNSYYDYRISTLKWSVILLIPLIVFQVILFYNSNQPLLYKGVILAVNLLLELGLIVFFLKKITKIESMK